jgi:hypothetical protein
MARNQGGRHQGEGAASRRGAALAQVLAAALLFGSLASSAAAPARYTDAGALGEPVLHVPSPDWRDQVLYFVMTDRFDDGDPANDDQHAGEYDPADPAKYNGGDFAGIARRLDYIRGLGATGVWVTPPVLNRWWDPLAQHGGYHGYWAKDFSRVDPHLGTLSDYQALSRRLHGAGMVLVQDIVLNHTGDYFEYDAAWDPKDLGAHLAFSRDTVGDTGPVQPPFDRNDPRKPGDRAAAIYHWTPKVRDYQDPRRRSTGRWPASTTWPARIRWCAARCVAATASGSRAPASTASASIPRSMYRSTRSTISSTPPIRSRPACWPSPRVPDAGPSTCSAKASRSTSPTRTCRRAASTR